MTIRGLTSIPGEMKIPMSNDIWDDDLDDDEDEPEMYIYFRWLSYFGYWGKYYRDRDQRWFRDKSEEI